MLKEEIEELIEKSKHLIMLDANLEEKVAVFFM
jgi:hypothetical protein